MNVLAVIPARGGSKGVPGKNLRPLHGRPLLGWTVEHALQATRVDRVVVSTDDERIASAARVAGAEVPFMRPAELARDDTPTEPVVLHALTELTATGYTPDLVVLLQATSPVRLPTSIDRAISQLIESGVDSLVGVVPQAPFLWESTDPPRAAYEVANRPRRQDMTATDLRYRETGSLYVTRRAVYEQERNRLGGRIGLFVMDEVEGLDIDTEWDLQLAAQAIARLAEEPA